MRAARSTVFFSLLLGVATAAEPPTDEKGIIGTWIIESAKDDGADESLFNGAHLTFKDGKAEIKLTGGEKLAGTYKLDPTAKPKAIDLGMKVGDFTITKKGLYSLDKNSLIICLALEQDAKRPGKLDGAKCSLWKLKRVK